MKRYYMVGLLVVASLAAIIAGRLVWEKISVERYRAEHPGWPPMRVAVIGSPPAASASRVSFDPIGVGEGLDRYEALWIQPSHAHLLTRPEGISTIRLALQQGKVVLFVGHADPPPEVLKALGVPASDRGESNFDQAGHYVWQQPGGGVKSGIVYIAREAKDKAVLEALLEATGNHLGFQKRPD